MSDKVEKTVEVKGEFLSHVIGKGGETVRAIREKAGAGVVVDIPKGVAPDARGTIRVSGPSDGVRVAVKEIERVVARREKALAGDDRLHDKAYASATRHAEARDRYFEESKAAFARGDKAAAKELSDKGKAEQAKLDAAKDKATRRVAEAKNKKNKSNELDLHGLQVDGALALLDKRYAKLVERGKYSTMTVMPGAGIHSDKDKGPRLKGEVIAWAKKNALTYRETGNGVFEIDLPKKKK